MEIKPKEDCRWDLVALGELLLRLDPGEERLHTAESFRLREGGGEYNVARALARCFGARTSLLSALVDNPVGRLLEMRVRAAGVDLSHLRWVDFDGVGSAARNGLNFTERGFGARAPLGMYDRGHTAASQLAPGAFDAWRLFARDGARFVHTGGIFAALSANCAGLAAEVLAEARRHGTRTSFDLNYRPSLWRERGGREAARAVNRELARNVEVLFGGLEDLRWLAGIEERGPAGLEPREALTTLLDALREQVPHLRFVASTLRESASASRPHWGAVVWHEGEIATVEPRQIDVLDRVGGGDAFAAGVLFGLGEGRTTEECARLGVAAGELAMSTPGDGCEARREEIEARAAGGDARAER